MQLNAVAHDSTFYVRPEQSNESGDPHPASEESQSQGL